MKILLDENFPLPLYHQLQSSDYDAEHIIAPGQRGIPDSELWKRLIKEELIFLTQDLEFLNMLEDHRAVIIVSHVRQSLPIRQRVEIWSKALKAFLSDCPPGKLFELLETGQILPWKTQKL